MNMKAVIMAGGKGTRISCINDDIPKPMIDICGKPLLERQIEWLVSQGVKEVTLIIGHMGDKITDYFNNGEKQGIAINYIVEKTPLGTGGGLFYILSKDKDPILLINGDIMLDINLLKLFEYHKKNNADITLLTHPNSHPYDSALIETDDSGRIINWMNKEDERTNYKNRVNAGIHIIERHTLEFMREIEVPKKIDLDRDFLKPNISNYKIYAYDTPEYVKDMGTPERYWAVCKDFEAGLVKRKNLGEKQHAIFLDRDGTINRHNDFIKKPDEMELIEGAAEAIKRINDSGFLAILITNQPVIARGDCSLEELQQIHNRLERLLGEKHAYLDDIFFCPHHPDKGFEGERLEYKTACECRKPKPGLIIEAAGKYNINLNESYMIGDSQSDVLAGENANCKTGLICDNISAKVVSANADILGNSLADLIERIFYDNIESTI